MEVISQVWRSDLALLALDGVAVEHHSTYVVADSGLLLLRRAPVRRDVPRLTALAESHFTDGRPIVIGVDDPDAVPTDLTVFDDAGFTVSVSIALVADAEAVTTDQAARYDVRPLASEEDWQSRARLLPLRRDEPAAADQIAAERRLSDAGHATWWGGFEGLRLVGSAGIVVLDGHSRCQGVDLDPVARGTGLAARLVAASVQHACSTQGATTSMVVAAKGHPAIGLYEEVGFRRREAQVRTSRPCAL
ncbi:GNAT family N-acetyltransferase [Nocardioides sp.]|uniref:GNAT family N-acetyltransferase n=1 Tax=Nocardioides sp. TaxID=35761 RepID=UPI001DC979DD|nr:GNAT family N-acetyltransferase [Nocardioides sp.]MBU1803046.1 GNAT family N-acetyltransferase [Actinomycetota bacterium]